MKVLVCKKTNKEFNDIQNKSGSITEHLKSLSIDVPSSYIRRKYFEKNKSYWHNQFFEIKEIKEKEKFKCKYCDWNTFDLKNVSGCYTTHIKKEHNKNIENYIEEFPEEKFKFSTFLNIKNNIEETSKENNHVICKICNKKVKYLTNTHLKNHKTTPEEYKIKYGVDSYASINFKNKSRNLLLLASKNITNSFVSKPEKDLKFFLENDLNIKILKNNKSLFGVEIDIVIPENKLCIEFNGNLYHSENYGKKNRNFHLNKTEICKNKGYKLIHINEDEWFLKNKIVKEKLKNILLLNDKPSIFARKCIIKQISPKEKNIFLNNNHIQGEDKSEINLGAFYKEELVSVMTFSSNRKMVNKKVNIEDFELKRFASDINRKIVGIFSKFISYFKKSFKCNTIFSFLDLRWNSDEINNLYIKNGFKLTNTLKPDYSYYNSKISRYKRFHKFGFGKSSIKTKFPNIFSDEKTEWEMMQELGYDRIWDCGKFKFEMKID